ncbi:hypothetical protein BBBOND_0308810 [Babesia bigemina]|uniref:Extracellular matrix-binding ebh n=1 Tax=Babesia bigemina TaxID=5866 RepID=A0A061D8V3_BABBI|nr:hypothetical protein BBBOND_0308810 [Babesia bigemina]CDR96978.1 hypothetical protein BBBOND_0308810 [Babesia bigemina]|eukprot:XP_012769164.1 hypothetical protein BBBOND_0308810 [Babesia bigemina]
MAPKALTDCPENLREAIDWLVQVRHCGGISTVSYALSTLFDNVAHDTEKSLPLLPDPDRPSARDVVSILRAFQSTLPKNSENPNKNILHNLCASAASLLGYSFPGTYDGSGIVYGNASRLCDAILAFLYAVFSDVHANQPYVAGRSVLYDDVIVELKSQLWRGHNGFCQAIPKVANGLQRYNAAVEASNKKVKNPIETVLDYMKTDDELSRGIKALQISETSTSAADERTVDAAVTLVERCKEIARVFSKSLTAAKDAIDDLNPKLKRKLENARNSFFNHVDWLSRWSKKGEKRRLDKMIQKIKTRLKKLAKAVKDKIKQEVHMLVELLKKRVGDIKMKLEGITASLEEYVKELGQWMGEAKEYINAVKKYVNKIMQELDGKHRKKIDKAAADIDSKLGKKVEELNAWIKDAEAAVNVAKKKADEVYGRLNKDDKDQKIRQGIEKITKANDAVSGVSTQLETVHKDLESWKDAAQDVLSNAAGKIGEVRGMLNPDKDGDDNPIGNNIKTIDAANREMANANKELGGKVKSLSHLIQDAESIRAAAQRKAEDAYENLDVHKELSENVQKIVDARKKISDARTGLKNVYKHLGEWNIEAERVLEGAVKKATEVFNMLNKNNAGNDISKGVTHITTAKEKVSHVDRELQKVYGDLDMWIEAAKNVLAISVNKAGDVHKMLNSDDLHGKYALGENIKEIGQAKTELDSANKTLKIQVENLNKWIQDAETIRQEAEEKVKEAYDKLQVHEKLSRKFGEIITANQKIKDVNAGINSVDRGSWNLL